MTYNLFISHSWSYPKAYDSIVKLLDGAPWFSYKNYSVPKNDPLEIEGRNYKEKLEQEIREQMTPCHCVLILAGVYASHSESIDLEIKLAKEMGKPIIAIELWGSEKTSKKVKENAVAVVGWNTSSIVNAIRKYSK